MNSIKCSRRAAVIISATKTSRLFRTWFLLFILSLAGAGGSLLLAPPARAQEARESDSSTGTPRRGETLIEILMRKQLFDLNKPLDFSPQAIIVNDLSTQTATALAQTLVGSGVQISNASFVGANRAGGTFSGGTGIIGFENGVILSSGDIRLVIGPNNSGSATGSNGTAGDTDLNTIVTPRTTQDAAVLQFSFVPTSNVVSFQYVFGSEEYNEFANSNFNDVFALYVNGVNVARLPQTTTPVSINTVNGGNPLGTNPQNPTFYRNNDFQNGTAPFDTQLDGMTVVLNVQATVTPGQVNTIKLAIADVGDSQYDSAVFIRSNSISSLLPTTLTVAPASGPSGGTTNLSATLRDASNNTLLAGKTVNFRINGTPVGSATTNASGVASLSNVSLLNVTPGNYPSGVEAFFTGDTTYNGSSGTAALTVGAPVCNYSISPISQNVPAAGGTYGFNVVTGATCTWTPTVNNAPWITVPGGVRTGSGTVTYTVAANTVTTSRTGTINVQDKVFTVNQNGANNLTYTISGRVTGASGGLSGVTVTLNGPITRTTVTDAGGNYEFGNLPPATYTVNPSFAGAAFTPASSSVTITGANVPNQDFALATCTYSLSQNATPLLPAGVSTGSFSVFAAGNCNWSARSNVPWIVIANQGSGSGNNIVNYTVQHNYNEVRSGTISVNGRIFTVNQNGNFQPTGINPGKDGAACDVTLLNGSPALNRQVIPYTGGSVGIMNVDATTSACQWTANKNVPWITTASGGNLRTGDLTETFTIEPYISDTATLPRIGIITVLGREFTVIQTPSPGACNYAVNPASRDYGASGGGESFTVTTSNTCSWLAASLDSWIKIPGSSNGIVAGPFGNRTKTFTVEPNTGTEARTGTIVVGDKALIINQAAGQAASCNYQLSAPDQNLAATAGAGSFTVTTGAGCNWSAVREASATWLTINGGNGPGNGTVSFTLAANPNATARNATITVNNQTFTVRQAGAGQTCSYSLDPGFQNIPNTGATSSVTVTANTTCPTQWTAVSNAEWITITSGAAGTSGTGTFSFVAQANNSPIARVGTITVAGQTFTVTQAANTNSARVRFDFDGDFRADISVFRPENGTWYINRSSGGFSGSAFGAAGDRLAPADYDGDGKTDLAVWRETTPTHAYFYLLMSATNTFVPEQFGTTGDVPLTGDWNGDGKADLTVYRNGATAGAQSFFFYRSVGTPVTSFSTIYWGASGDRPVPADYDGDGKTDAAVFNPSNGVWFVSRSSDGQSQGTAFGLSTDKLVPADYDGDGQADVAVYRSGTWFIQRTTQGFTGVLFGAPSDLPTPADYDGDGKADIAVYRSGIWFLNRTQSGFTGVQFGAPNDRPAPNSFVQ